MIVCLIKFRKSKINSSIKFSSIFLLSIKSIINKDDQQLVMHLHHIVAAVVVVVKHYN